MRLVFIFLVFSFFHGLHASTPGACTPSVSTLAEDNEKAWEAYNDHRLADALSLFKAALKSNPSDLDALFGWVMLSGTVEGAPTYLDISERLLDMKTMPIEFCRCIQIGIVSKHCR